MSLAAPGLPLIENDCTKNKNKKKINEEKSRVLLSSQINSIGPLQQNDVRAGSERKRLQQIDTGARVKVVKRAGDARSVRKRERARCRPELRFVCNIQRVRRIDEYARP